MKRRQGPAAPSQRQLKVGEQMRHLIAEALMRGEIHDSRLETTSLTVTEVQVTRDLKHATAYVVELGQPLREETSAALKRIAPALTGLLARRMNLKYAPRLRFVEDETIEHAARLDALIKAERDRTRGD